MRPNSDDPKSLFIALKAKFYWMFWRKEKEWEYRQYGPRWNERTCFVGRPAVLSLGYGKKHRIHTKIAEFKKEHMESADWVECYGKPGIAACIRMEDF